MGMRAVPDVAAVADPHRSALSIAYLGDWRLAGGTSAASPIWAGIAALFGEYLANKGASLQGLVKQTPGGFNGLLYKAKVAQGASSGFYSIVQGSNDLSLMPCGVCSAAGGYDDITGLGVPNVAALFANF
jgi:subtilase family serine protease